MALYLFSDAHLGAGPPDKETLKLKNISRLCELVKTDGDRLVILGDLFDFWFEYKQAIPKDQFAVLYLLYDLRQKGIKIDYISGNHDFWMDDFFTNQLQFSVHQDHLNLEYAGKKLHLIHGDGLAPGDKGYRLLKKILRNRFNIWLYRLLPADFAISLAKKVSGSSREYTARRDHHFAKDYEQYAEKKLRDGFDLVAIGHLHLPVSKKFGEGLYLNSGDFINHFTYIKIDANKAELLSLNEN